MVEDTASDPAVAAGAERVQDVPGQGLEVVGVAEEPQRGVPSPAVADDPSASASPAGDEAGPTEAGTTFRTATALKQGQSGIAQASAGAVVEALRAVARAGATVVVASYDPVVVDGCDDVIRLEPADGEQAA